MYGLGWSFDVRVGNFGREKKSTESYEGNIIPIKKGLSFATSSTPTPTKNA